MLRLVLLYLRGLCGCSYRYKSTEHYGIMLKYTRVDQVYTENYSVILKYTRVDLVHTDGRICTCLIYSQQQHTIVHHSPIHLHQ